MKSYVFIVKNRLLPGLILLISLLNFTIYGHPADPNSKVAKFALFATDSISFGSSALKNIKFPAGPVGTNGIMDMKEISWNAGEVIFYDDIFIKNHIQYSDDKPNTLALVNDTGKTCFLDVNGTLDPPYTYPDFPVDQTTIVSLPVQSSDIWYQKWPEDSIPTSNIDKIGGTIPPGTYGKVTINGITNFEDGEYNIRELVLNPNGQLIVHKGKDDLCRIFVKEQINFGASGTNGVIIKSVLGDDDLGKILIYTTATEISTNEASRVLYAAEINASLVAPRAKINFLDNPTIKGQVLARSIYFRGDFDASDGIFVPWDPSEVSMVGAATFQITEGPATRFVSIPIALSAGMDTVGATVDYAIETYNGLSSALNDGIDFNNDTTISSLTSVPNGTLHFDKNSETPKDSILVHIIDDIIPATYPDEEEIEYFILKLYNPNIAVLAADPDAYKISYDPVDSSVTELQYLIPIINDDNDNDPIAINDAITVDENDSSSILNSGIVSLMDLVSDVDLPNDNLTITASNANHGTFTLNSDNTFKYVNHGLGVEYTSDTVSFTVSDALGNSAIGFIFITINLINDEIPSAKDDTIHVSSPGGVKTILTNNSLSVLNNDFDLDADDTLKATLLDSPFNGTLELNPTGTFTYTHINLTNLLDSATYICVDAAGHKDTAKILIGISLDFSTDPTASNDFINVLEGDSTKKLINDSTSLFWNDSGNDVLDQIKGFIISEPKHGTFSLDSATGTFTYKHDDSENFADTVIYYVEDLYGLKDTASVFITIEPVNDNIPVVYNDTIVVIEGESTNKLKSGAFSVLANDTDIDGMSVVTSALSQDVSLGTLELHPDGSFTYTHNGTEMYADSFKYVAIDEGDTTNAEAMVTIIIIPIPKPSLITAASYHDVNGDGNVDSLHIEFSHPFNLEDSLGNALTTFQIEWDSIGIFDLPIGFSNIYNGGQTVITDISNLFPLIKTSGEMKLHSKFTLNNPKLGKLVDTILEPANILDKAAPVLTKAIYCYNEEHINNRSYDNLIIEFSEEITDFENDSPFIFIKEDLSEYSINLNLNYWNANKNLIKCRVFNLFDPLNPQNSSLYPSEEDSVWIWVNEFKQNNPSSFIEDVFGNKQRIYDNRKVPLLIKEEDIVLELHKLDFIGDKKPIIPDVLQVGNFTEGTVLLLTLGNTGSISLNNFKELILASKIEARVYDLVGNEVITTSTEHQNNHFVLDVKAVNNKPSIVINWDVRNSNGRAAATGAYYTTVTISGTEKLDRTYTIKWNVRQYID